MLVAGVNIIEHMPRFCNWNSIMTALMMLRLMDYTKALIVLFLNIIVYLHVLWNHVIKKRNIAWSLGFDNYYKNTISDHVRVPKFCCT